MLYVMADNNVLIPSKRDGALYNFLTGNQDYVFKGIGNEFKITTSTSSLLVTLGTGEGILGGRHVTEETVNNANSMIQLSANSSGYVTIRIDLSRPAGTEAYLCDTSALVSQDLNGSGTIRDLPLYQYSTDASGVSAWTDIRPLASGQNVINFIENGTLYVAYFENNVLVRKQVGSLDPDELTATPSDVKSGVIFGGNGSDDAQTGTFEGQTKTVTAGTSAKDVTPDSGKYLTKVTVNPTPSQTKTATPKRVQQTIAPDSGKYLSSVTVARAQPKTVSRVGSWDWYYDRTSGTLSITGITVGNLILIRYRNASAGSGISINSGMTRVGTSGSANSTGNPETIWVGYATATTIVLKSTAGEYYVAVDQISYAGD